MLNAGRLTIWKPALLQRLHVSRADQVVTVDVAGLQFLGPSLRVGDRLDDDRGDLGLVTPVVVIALQRELLTAVPLVEDERAGAGRVRRGVLGEAGVRDCAPGLVGVVLLQRIRALHRERRQGHRLDERGERLLELDHGLVRARRRATVVDSAGLAGLETLEQARVVVADVRILVDPGPVVPAVEVVADGLGVEVGAVVEFDPVTQRERIAETILRSLPLGGQQRLGVGGAGLGAHQTLEHLPGRPERLAVTGQRRIEHHRVRRCSEDEGVVRPAGACSALRSALTLGAGCQRHGKSGRGEDCQRLLERIGEFQRIYLKSCGQRASLVEHLLGRVAR